MSIENLSLLCIPFKLEPMPIPLPLLEPSHRHGNAADDEVDLRWAGAASG